MAQRRPRAARESSDQTNLVRLIRRAGWLVVHTPNQGRRTLKEAAALQVMGLIAGFPDLMIYGCPEGRFSGCPGVGIEMLREATRRSVPAHREAIYQQLETHGWRILRECTGRAATIHLVKWGYLPPSDLPGWAAAEEAQDV